MTSGYLASERSSKLYNEPGQEPFALKQPVPTIAPQWKVNSGASSFDDSTVGQVDDALKLSPGLDLSKTGQALD